MQSFWFRASRVSISALFVLLARSVNAQVDHDNPIVPIDGAQLLETVTVNGSLVEPPPLSSAFLTYNGSIRNLSRAPFERNPGERLVLRSAYQGEGPCPHGDDTAGSEVVRANPIVLSTGNKVEPETDFDSIGEMPLTLERTYNHNWSYVGIFGMYWVSNLDYTITIASDEQTVYGQRPDGRRIKFNRDPGNSNRWSEDRPTPLAAITRTGTGFNAVYTLVTEDNYVETYDYEGRIKLRSNIGGVSWKFVYTNRLLTSVTRSSGRTDGSGRTMTLSRLGNTLSVIGPDASTTNTYVFNTTALDGDRRLDTVQLAGAAGSPMTTVTYHYENQQLPGALTGKSYNGQRYSTFAYDSSGRATDSKHAGATAGTFVDAYHFEYSGTLTDPPGGPNDPPPPGWECNVDDHVCHPVNSVVPAGSSTISTAATEKALVRMIPAATSTVVETNPLGYVTTYTFEDGRLKTTLGGPSAHCGLRSSSRTYDLVGYDDVVTDFNGNKTDYLYLGTGQLDNKVEGSQSAITRTTSYTYEPYSSTWHRPLTKTVSGLNKTTYAYTSLSNRIQSVTIQNLVPPPYGVLNQLHTWNYTYTYWNGATGTVKTMTVDGPLLGDSVTTEYTLDGDVFKVTTPTGVTTYTGYNVWGEPARVQGENGEITDYAYYPRGKLKSITTYPNGTAAATTTYVYAGELLSTVTTPDNVQTSYTYDNARRLWTTSRPEIAGTALRTLTYDASSNVTQIDDTLGGALKRRTKFEYDELDRVRTRVGMNSQSYTYTYDNNGNLKTETDSYSKTKTYQYDSLNRVSGWTGPLAHMSASFTYDAADLLKTVTDPHGVVTTYNRDGFGQLWREVSPDRGTTSYAWLSDGTLDTMTRGSGSAQPVQTSYVFDPMGRLQTVTASGQSETYTYDTCTNGKGRLCSATAPGTILSYVYELDGRLNTRQDKITVAGVQSTYNTLYAYDTVGRLSKLTYPNNDYATYTYTTGQPSTLTMTSAGITKTVVSAVGFEPFGSLSGYKHTNGLIRDYTFDYDGRYQGITSKNGATALQSLGFGYDNNDRVTTITNSLPDFSKAYGYDDLSHLTSATNAVLPLDLEYTYDNNHNRLTMGTNSSVYTYVTGTNRLSGVSNVFIAPDGTIGMGGNKPAYDSSFTYDGAGNIKAWDISFGGLIPTYAYDGFNRMTSVVDTFSGTVPYGEYGYNAFGERTSKRDRINGNNYSFIYGEGHKLIADKEDAVWTNYLWFAGELVAMTRSGATYDIDSDQVGRPELLTNGSKQVVWQSNSQPYGLRVITPSNAIEFNIGFPGQYYDKETHYWYNVNRYYIDALGRYLQPDPIGLAGGLNPYVYVYGNPSNYIDPYGLEGLDPLWGFVYGATGGWSPSSAVVNGVTGFGDGVFAGITFGLGDLQDVRDAAGIEGGVDPCSDEYNIAKIAGEIEGSATLGGSLASKAFRPGGWTNANRYLRVGFGRNGGNTTFRAAGQWVQQVAGRGHVDFWTGGPL